MALTYGSRPTLFAAATQQRPDFAFSSLGGFYILMAFMPRDPAAHDAAMALLEAQSAAFDAPDRISFGVTRDRDRFDHAHSVSLWLRQFHDPEGVIAGHFHLNETEVEHGCFVLLDPSLRVLLTRPLDQAEKVYATVSRLSPADGHAGVPIHAPILIVPRVFEHDFCRRLIDVYHQEGGTRSGVMREIDGKTVGVIDNFKNRKDATVHDPELQRQIQLRIAHRLFPEIQKAFAFQATRMERYIVARYSAEEGGYFRPHRDNNTRGTAHRQFACSINLNAEEFEGGDLRFAEFGTRTYRPPTGGAVIFSCSLLHEATPVTKGTRFAFLPFFYDDAHAKIRQENAHFLSGTVEDRTINREEAAA